MADSTQIANILKTQETQAASVQKMQTDISDLQLQVQNLLNGVKKMETELKGLTAQERTVFQNCKSKEGILESKKPLPNVIEPVIYLLHAKHTIGFKIGSTYEPKGGINKRRDKILSDNDAYKKVCERRNLDTKLTYKAFIVIRACADDDVKKELEGAELPKTESEMKKLCNTATRKRLKSLEEKVRNHLKTGEKAHLESTTFFKEKKEWFLWSDFTDTLYEAFRKAGELKCKDYIVKVEIGDETEDLKSESTSENDGDADNADGSESDSESDAESDT